MRICENGTYRDMTPEEITALEAARQTHERHYWTTTDYDSAVNAEIRKKYTASQEFAVLRQKDEKPCEYAQYFSYCESCKAYVKRKMGEVST